MKTAIQFIAIALLFFTIQLQARHLTGGYMEHKCIGNGVYDMTLTVYKDCLCINCAFFDNPASIAIYRCEKDSLCTDMLSQSNTYSTLMVDFSALEVLDYSSQGCGTDASNICIEQAIYKFQITLPAQDQNLYDYYIVYDRCCRNVTISNIVEPENTGFSIFNVIKGVSADYCNQSAENFINPAFTCVNEPMFLNAGLVDSDGDSLVYSFCSPYIGGGHLGTNEFPGDPYLCDGVIPTPPCPPSYETVTFISPTYSVQQPIVCDPMIAIDPMTGLITGTPQLLGQYLVGICVDEYRDGILLNSNQIQFELNVTNAEMTSIEEQENIKELHIFPNPTKDIVHIQLSNHRLISNISLLNNMGHLVKHQTVDSANPILSLKDLPKGIYWLRVEKEYGYVETEKLLVF